MNERIRALAKQAQKVIWSADGKVTELTDLDVEKFAELIVRECADISDASFHDGSAGYLAILNHFGVK